MGNKQRYFEAAILVYYMISDTSTVDMKEHQSIPFTYSELGHCGSRLSRREVAIYYGREQWPVSQARHLPHPCYALSYEHKIRVGQSPTPTKTCLTLCGECGHISHFGYTMTK